MTRSRKITQTFRVFCEGINQPPSWSGKEISEQEYHDWAALLNQLSAYDGKKWGAIKGMTEKYGWVEGYAVSSSQDNNG